MQLIKNRIFLAKLETVIGTDPTPTVGSNAVEVRNLKMGYSAAVLTRDNIRGNISQVAPVIGSRFVDISFDVEMKGSGAVGTAGQLSAILQACSFAETASAGSSVVYLPTSVQNAKTITIYVYNLDAGSARLHKITACVGNVSFKIDAGQIAIASFTMKGKYNLPTDVALPSTPTYESTTPPAVENAAFSLNSVTSLILKSLGIDMGNVTSTLDDISSPNGINKFIVSARMPKGTFAPEAALVVGYDWWSDWVASTKRALSVTVGATAGNIITITAPKVVIDSIKDGDNQGVLTTDNSFQLGLNAGDDEIQIKFT